MNAQVNNSISAGPASQSIQAFLLQLRPNGLQNLTAILPNGEGIVGKTFEMPHEVAAAAAWAMQYNQQGYGVYFTVNPVNQRVDKKPAKADIATGEFVHLDLDPDLSSMNYAQARQYLLDVQVPKFRKGACPPTFMIDSGNGVGVFWKLSEAVDVETGEDLNRRAIALYGGDKGTGNADRLMRLPYLTNYSNQKKIDKGYPEKTVAGMVYDPEDKYAYTAEALAGVWPAVEKATVVTPSVQAKGAALQWAPEPLSTVRLADIESALNAIGTDDEYHEWVSVGMALRQEAGNEQDSQVLFDIWNEWSSHGTDYPGDAELKYKWSTFTRKAGGVTIGTVFDRAKKLGWTKPSDIVYEKFMASLPTAPTALENATEEISDTEPLDLFSEVGVPEWSPEHYPAVVGGYAADIARRIGCDPAVPCWAMLAYAAGIAGEMHGVQVKRRDTGWIEQPRLWVAVVGEPAAKKTPGTKPIKKAIDKVSQRYDVEHAKARAEYEPQLEAWKRSNRKSKDSDEVQPQPESPKRRQICSGDLTVEGLARILADNPDGIIVDRDELSGWFGSMDAYRASGVSKDRSDWLMAWNGGYSQIDRAQRSTSVPNWSVSIFGGIQPEPMRKIASKIDDDGLLQRFLPIAVRPALHGEDVAPDAKLEQAWMHVVAGLEHTRGAQGAIVYRMSPDGQALFDRLRRYILSLSEMPNYDSRLKTALAKLEGIAARLLITYHLIESSGMECMGINTPLVIPTETVLRVVRLVKQYLVQNLHTFYHGVLGLHGSTEHAIWIAGHILHKTLQVISARDIGRAYNKLRDDDGPHKIQAAMHHLYTAGWVEPVDDGKGRPPKKWVVNPQVHTLFRERASVEHTRREEVRAKIAEAARLQREDL